MIKSIKTALDKRFIDVFIVFIILQPVFDILTSLMVKFSISSVTIGLFIRVLMLAIVLCYSLFIVSSSKYKKYLIAYIVLIGIYALAYGAITIMYKGSSFLFIEFKALMKLLYFPIMLASLFCVFMDKDIHIDGRKLSAPALIYSILIIVAVVTGTSFLSYRQGKLGSAGWYYAPNEIGAILAILFPIYYTVLFRRGVSWYYYAILPVYLFVGLWIGTKAPMLGVIFTLGAIAFIYLIRLAFQQNKRKNLAIVSISVLLCVLVILLVPLMPVGKNMNTHFIWANVGSLQDFFASDEGIVDNDSGVPVDEPDGQDTDNKTTDTDGKPPADKANVVFSSRNVYLAKMREAFESEPTLIKLMGKGFILEHGGDRLRYVSVEIDFFDIFFRLGIIGTIIYFIPIGVFGLMLITAFFKRPRNFTDDVPIGYILALGLSFGLAALAGHVLTAPAVSIYVALIIIGLLQYRKGKGREVL